MMFKPRTKMLLGILLLFSFQTASACQMLIGELRRNWFDVESHLVPMGSKLERPDDDGFVCVSRYKTRDAMESSVGVNTSFRCFRPTSDQRSGFCCDTRLMSCAQVHPGLLPETDRVKKEKAYEPPKSQWVRPPSEGDQWNSN
jgi:hypothetical protein